MASFWCGIFGIMAIAVFLTIRYRELKQVGKRPVGSTLQINLPTDYVAIAAKRGWTEKKARLMIRHLMLYGAYLGLNAPSTARLVRDMIYRGATWPHVIVNLVNVRAHHTENPGGWQY